MVAPVIEDEVPFYDDDRRIRTTPMTAVTGLDGSKPAENCDFSSSSAIVNLLRRLLVAVFRMDRAKAEDIMARIKQHSREKVKEPAAEAPTPPASPTQSQWAYSSTRSSTGR